MHPLHSAFVIGSNLVSVPSAVRWYQFGHGIVPLIILNSGFWSTVYHTCDQTNACMMEYQLLHDLDFFFAQFLPLAVIIALVHWVSPSPQIAYPVGVPFLQTAFFVLFGVINAVLIAHLGTDVATQGIVGLMGIGLIVLYLLGYYAAHLEWPTYNLVHAVPTVVLLGTSILLFDEQNSLPDFYWLIHGAWHLLAYMGIWFAPAIMPEYPAWLNVGDQMPMPMPMSSEWDSDGDFHHHHHHHHQGDAWTIGWMQNIVAQGAAQPNSMTIKVLKVV